MPKIRAETLADHHDLVWRGLIDGLERLLAAKPYEELTLAEVAAAAGMARNTIYNYARDKGTLLAQAAEFASEDLLRQVAGLAAGARSGSERLSEMISAMFAWFSSGAHRHLVLQSFFRDSPAALQARAGAPLTEIGLHVARVVGEGVAAGEFRRLEDPVLTVQLMSAVMHPALRRVAHRPDERALVEREVIGFLLGALSPEPEGRDPKGVALAPAISRRLP